METSNQTFVETWAAGIMLSGLATAPIAAYNTELAAFVLAVMVWGFYFYAESLQSMEQVKA